MTRRVLSLVAIGLLGGFLSGTFGIGGGVLMVPLLVLALGLDQRHASALSLTAVLPAAIIGAIGYGIQGNVDLAAAALVASGGIVGALIGTRLLRSLPLGWLRWGFIVLLLLIAVRMIIEVPQGAERLEFSAWTIVGLVALGLFVGIASGLFGIGGGVIIVPALIGLFGVGELIAKGTSLASMVPTSITGTVTNTRARLVRPVDGLLVGVPAAVASLPGPIVAHLLPTRVSHILFAVIVVIAAVQLAIKAWRSRRSN